MTERLTDKLREYLEGVQGRVVNLKELRAELRIDPKSSAWDGIRVDMLRFSKEKIVRPSGRNDGFYKVVTQVKPVKVFVDNRERRSPFKLFFPREFDTGMEMGFAEFIVIREGDVLTLGGKKNRGKTALALNLCGENIDYNPILMGNEYTIRVGDTDEFEPTPRFLNRLDHMDWVQWTDGAGGDKFTLLPIKGDYAEHIKKDRINIIDWINLDADRLYDISKVMDDIKAELGRGIAIIVLQKGEGDAARGGQFTKDFTDCELLIDGYSNMESMLTIGEVKETTAPIMGKKFAFGISQGVKIINFREIIKCSACYGKGWVGNKPCEVCWKTGYTDK